GAAEAGQAGPDSPGDEFVERRAEALDLTVVELVPGIADRLHEVGGERRDLAAGDVGEIVEVNEGARVHETGGRTIGFAAQVAVVGEVVVHDGVEGRQVFAFERAVGPLDLVVGTDHVADDGAGAVKLLDLKVVL